MMWLTQSIFCAVLCFLPFCLLFVTSWLLSGPNWLVVGSMKGTITTEKKPYFVSMWLFKLSRIILSGAKLRSRGVLLATTSQLYFWAADSHLAMYHEYDYSHYKQIHDSTFLCICYEYHYDPVKPLLCIVTRLRTMQHPIIWPLEYQPHAHNWGIGFEQSSCICIT